MHKSIVTCDLSAALFIKNNKNCRNGKMNWSPYFADKSKNSSKTNKSDSSEKIHPTNRDPGGGKRDKSKSWTFLDSMAETMRQNKVYFFTGFVLSAILCTFVILSDSSDRYGVHEYVMKHDYGSILDNDRPLGYERSLKKEKENNPELYDV